MAIKEKGFTPTPERAASNMLKKNTTRLVSGFTLIELLIVIGILGILSTTTVLVINPAELLRQARDAQRLSDFKTIRGAIDLYLARGISSPLNLYDDGNDVTPTCTAGNSNFPRWRSSLVNFSGQTDLWLQPFISSGGLNGIQSPQEGIVNPADVLGDGWVPVAFNEVLGVRPLTKLPLDPINSAPPQGSLAGDGENVPKAYFYAYQCQGLTYELNANMESKKYSLGGSHDVESTDGGTNARYYNPLMSLNLTGLIVANAVYEVGNDPGLDL